MNTLTKSALALCWLGSCLTASAQTVTSGEKTIDKNKVSGLILTVPGDGKQIEKDWEDQLKSFGKVTSSRGTYKISTAYVPAVSSEPINLLSQVDRSRNSTTIFAAFDQGGGNFVTSGSGNYGAAEKLLNDFAAKAVYNMQVREVEGLQTEADKNYQKTVRNGEKLQRDMERNKKDKENLLKRLDDNAKDLEKLTQEIETNKTNVATGQTELDNRRKATEAVKAKGISQSN